MTESTVEQYPVIRAVDLDIRYADDELVLSDFVEDVENLLSAMGTGITGDLTWDESTPNLLRELLDAIQAGWTAAGASREASA